MSLISGILILGRNDMYLWAKFQYNYASLWPGIVLYLEIFYVQNFSKIFFQSYTMFKWAENESPSVRHSRRFDPGWQVNMNNRVLFLPLDGLLPCLPPVKSPWPRVHPKSSGFFPSSALLYLKLAESNPCWIKYDTGIHSLFFPIKTE